MAIEYDRDVRTANDLTAFRVNDKHVQQRVIDLPALQDLVDRQLARRVTVLSVRCVLSETLAVALISVQSIDIASKRHFRR